MALKLKLAGYPLTILAVTPTSRDARGECEFRSDESMVIRVDPTLGNRAFMEVFIHELVEAANGVYALELPHPTIQTLGVGISQCLPAALAPLFKSLMLPPKKKGAKKKSKSKAKAR